MRKYFYNIFLIIKNINNYGILTFLYASIIEIYFLLKFWDFHSFTHDDSATSTYEETKINQIYNTQHTPTPYFFLLKALDFIKKEKINDFILIDMGCGYGRVGKFFLSRTKCEFYGLEINNKFIDKMKNFSLKNKNFNIYCIDLRNKEFRNKIFDTIKNKKKKIVLFFSDPFDIDTIIDILNSFKKNDHIVIGINVNKLDKLLLNYKIKYVKFFQNKLRHIVLLNKK